MFYRYTNRETDKGNRYNPHSGKLGAPFNNKKKAMIIVDIVNIVRYYSITDFIIL